jgi:hypothetical protein
MRADLRRAFVHASSSRLVGTSQLEFSGEPLNFSPVQQRPPADFLRLESSLSYQLIDHGASHSEQPSGVVGADEQRLSFLFASSAHVNEFACRQGSLSTGKGRVKQGLDYSRTGRNTRVPG